MNDLNLLQGVPEDYVRSRLAAAGGDEIASGKFRSLDSSAALAVNAFAWFHGQPDLLPILPGSESAGWPALGVEVEYSARFPWAGGRHPWLDAFVTTATHILGIESKRHEPFRDAKRVDLSEAYDRPVWGTRMGPFESLRDRLRSGEQRFKHLDAAQLVKHAFGLITESQRIENKHPLLVYLYDEPKKWPAEDISLHRVEVETFTQAVGGAAVRFIGVRWQDWLTRWSLTGQDAIKAHAQSLRERFGIAF
jgi:hypothetical protein